MESITLQTSDSSVNSNDVLGRLAFAASNEASTSDARLVAAMIKATAEGDFTSIANPTSLVFATASSETATDKLKLTSGGHLIPVVSGAFDLGSSSLPFRNLYVDNLVGYSLSLSGNLSGDINLNSYNIVGTGNISISGDITANNANLDVISFNVDNESILTKGQISWDDTEGTMDIGLTDNTTIHIGEHRYFRIRNETGGVLYKGQVVYATGVHSNGLITPSKYVADGSVREVRFMGAVLEDVNNQNNGYVVDFGHLQDMDLDGSASNYAVGDETWVAGDILYVHPTVAGKLTKVEPKHSISVAIVLDPGNGNGNGRMFVRPTSYGHLNDNHDVDTSGVVNGQMLRYISSSDIWTTGIIYDNGTNVGIGTASPSQFNSSFNQLVIGGGSAYQGATIYSTTQGTLAFGDTATNGVDGYRGYLAYIHNTDYMLIGTAGAERVRITAAGNVGIGTIGTIPTSKLQVEGGNVTFNDNGDNFDFRVEGDTLTHLIHTDASKDEVVIHNAIGYGLNYATSEGWVQATGTPTLSQVGYYGGNFESNGAAENYVDYSDLPNGLRGLVWQSRDNGTDNSADGGWYKLISGLDPNKTYISIVYFRRVGSSTTGTFYHGCKGNDTINLNGTTNSNPYFHVWGMANFPQDVWCVSIGIIHANNDTISANSGFGGIYRLDTGEKIYNSSTDYKMAASATIQAHRTYLYYDAVGDTDADWCWPGFYEVTADSIVNLLNTILYNHLNFSGRNITINEGGGNYDFRVEGDSDEYLLFTDASLDYIGIGTPNPLAKFNVQGTKDVNYGTVNIQDSTSMAANVGGDIIFGGKYTTAGDYARYGRIGGIKENSTGGNSQSAMIFHTNAGGSLAERMRITSAGNVGIGTNNPLAQLHVITTGVSSFRVESTQSYTYATLKHNSPNQWAYLEFNNDGVNRAFLQQNGTTTSNWGGPNALSMYNYAGPLVFGTNTTSTFIERMAIDVSGNITINDGGLNSDFRVEGDTDANLLFTDASTDRVGIGTSTPQAKLDVNGTVQFDNLVRWEFPDKPIDTNISALGYLRLYDESGTYCGLGVSSSSFNIGSVGGINLRLLTNGTERTIIDTNGNFIFNEAGNNCDFRIEGDTDPNLLFVDASVDDVGIGTNNPTEKLDVNGSIKTRAGGVGHEDNGCYIAYPGGGTLRSGTVTQTGYLKITLPVSWTSTMIQFELDLYEYSTGLIKKFRIGGYNFSGSSAWFNPSVMMDSDNDSTKYRVHFGHDGTYCAIYISEINSSNVDLGASSTWAYSQGSISNFFGGWSNMTMANWADGWSIGFTTTLGTISATRESSRPYRQHDTSYVFNEYGGNVDFRVEGDTDSNLLFTDASTDRVGIGTNMPLDKIMIQPTNATTDLNGMSIRRNSTWAGVYTNKYLSYVWRDQTAVVAAIGASYDGTSVNIDFHSMYNAEHKTSADVVMSIHGDGNIGIGTKTPTARLNVESGNIIFNDLGGNYDFRVEGDSDADLLFTDASTDRVGIGLGSATFSVPTEKLDIKGSFGIHQTYKIASSEVYTSGAGSVNGVSITLNQEHGTVLNTNFYYLVRLHTNLVGSGLSASLPTIDSGSSYLVWYNRSTSSWVARAIGLSGTTAEHPLLGINGSNAIAYTNSPSGCRIYINVEAYFKTINRAVPHYMGSDYHWQRSVNNLYYTDGNVGIGTNDPSSSLHVVGTTRLIGPIIEGYNNVGNTSTSKTIALTNGTIQNYTLTANCIFTMPTATAGQSFTVFLRTGTGNFTATFTGVKWSAGTAPTITTTASRMDIISFVSDGANWYGSFSQNYTP